MKRCGNTTPTGRCPNPAAAGRNMCAVCLGITFDDEDLENQIIAVEVGPVTTGGFPDPKEARANQRTCMALRDDGSGECGKPAMKKSPFCEHHQDARRQAELDQVPDLSRCIRLTPEGQCNEPSVGRGLCQAHHDEFVVTEGASPKINDPIDFDDEEQQLRYLHRLMALLGDIIENGKEDKARVNAARAYQRLQWQAGQLHKDWIKRKRAQAAELPFEIDGLKAGGHNRVSSYMHIDDLRDSLPEGDTL